MTTSIDTSHLLRHDGQIVPWVTRWSGEIAPQSVSLRRSSAGALVATYDDDIPDNRDWDHGGVVWQRESVSRAGEPQFGYVNTLRQRSAMRHGRCEVCGRRITDRPINWLVPETLLSHVYGDPVTAQAPTCDECLPIAMDLCPFLRRRTARLLMARVLEYRTFGAFGNGFLREGDAVRQVHGAVFPYVDCPADLTSVIAQKEVVQWTKFTMTEVPR